MIPEIEGKARRNWKDKTFISILDDIVVELPDGQRPNYTLRRLLSDPEIEKKLGSAPGHVIKGYKIFIFPSENRRKYLKKKPDRDPQPIVLTTGEENHRDWTGA